MDGTEQPLASAASTPTPVRRGPVRLLPALFMLLGTLYLLPGMTRPVVPHDEGVIAVGATRVLAGEVPYRDFWTFYAPAQFYVVAGLFRSFGVTLFSLRLYDTLVRAFLAVLVFLVGRRLASSGWALVAWVFALMWCGAFSFYGYPIFPALALLTGALLLMTGTVRPEGLRFTLSGALVGLAGLFRHDYALVFFVPAALLVVLLAGRAAVTAARPARHSCSSARAILLYAGGAVVVVLPVAFYFLVVAGSRELIADLVVFPTKIFPLVREMPWPSFLPHVKSPIRSILFDPTIRSGFVRVLPFYLPLFVAVVAGILILARLATERLLTSRLVNAAGLVVLTFCMVPQVAVRSDLPHMLPVLVLCPALMAFVATEWGRRTSLPRLMVTTTCGLILILLLDWPLRERLHRPSAPQLETTDSAVAARAWPAGLPPALASVAGFIREHVEPGQRIFVGGRTHARILESDALLYFLADRVPATRHHELHEGVVTTRAVQQEIIADLNRHVVEFVVLNVARDVEREFEPNRLGPGSNLLDEYLQTAFVPYAMIGDTFLVLRRNDPDAPPRVTKERITRESPPLEPTRH